MGQIVRFFNEVSWRHLSIVIIYLLVQNFKLKAFLYEFLNSQKQHLFYNSKLILSCFSLKATLFDKQFPFN